MGVWEGGHYERAGAFYNLSSVVGGLHHRFSSAEQTWQRTQRSEAPHTKNCQATTQATCFAPEGTARRHHLISALGSRLKVQASVPTDIYSDLPKIIPQRIKI